MDFKVLREEELSDKIGIVVGTRPSIVKMSPLIHELERKSQDYLLIHTGQHYSRRMSDDFLEELGLPEPHYRCETVEGCILHGEQTAEMLVFTERVLIKEKPKVLLVGGDANMNLAAALAARKLHIRVGHVEAGLRSHDWRMPEEHNRVMIDHISEYLFAPSERARRTLERDGVRGEIYVVGSTIADVVKQSLKRARESSNILNNLGLEDYFLITMHREENVDNGNTLRKVLNTIEEVIERNSTRIVFPIHPRTRKRLKEFGLLERAERLRELMLIDAVGYLDFLLLLSEARLVLTDSGGVQQEACILHTPCVTLRDETEWTETVEAGANITTGIIPPRVLRGVEKMLDVDKNWGNPFGTEGTAKRILDVLRRRLSQPILCQMILAQQAGKT